MAESAADRRALWQRLGHSDATAEALERYAPCGELPFPWEWCEPKMYHAAVYVRHSNGESSVLSHTSGCVVFEPDESATRCAYVFPVWLVDAVRSVGEAYEQHMAGVSKAGGQA